MVELVEGRGACGCACGKGLGTRALWRARKAVGSGGHTCLCTLAVWLPGDPPPRGRPGCGVLEKTCRSACAHSSKLLTACKEQHIVRAHAPAPLTETFD